MIFPILTDLKYLNVLNFYKYFISLLLVFWFCSIESLVLRVIVLFDHSTIFSPSFSTSTLIFFLRISFRDFNFSRIKRDLFGANYFQSNILFLGFESWIMLQKEYKLLVPIHPNFIHHFYSQDLWQCSRIHMLSEPNSSVFLLILEQDSHILPVN